LGGSSMPQPQQLLSQDLNQEQRNITREFEMMLVKGDLPIEHVVRFVSNKELIFGMLQNKHADLMSQPIGAADAARQYDLKRPNINKLVHGGYVREMPAVKKGGGGYPQMQINHGDLVVYLEMRRLFNDGKPGPIKGFEPPFKQQMAKAS
jgi:hypothetical protein